MSSSLGPLRAALAGASAAALCAGAAPGPARADPAPAFGVLLQSAQASAPRLAVSAADVAQAQGLARQSGVRPNPSVSLSVENLFGSGPFKGAEAAETTLALEQPLELGAKRPARLATGRAQVEAARAKAQMEAASFAFDLAQAYGAAEAADIALRLNQDAIDLATEDARIAGALVQAGQESELRTLQARAAVQAARAELDAARAERISAFATLTALAGAEAPLTSIPVSLLDRADRPDIPAEADALTTPAYRLAQAERELAARQVRLEQTRTAPDLSVSLGVRRVAGSGTALVAGLSAPFPLFDRNGGNASAAQAQLRATEARLTAARLDGQAQIASAGSRAVAAQTRTTALRDSEVAADEAYRLTRIAYEGGKAPLIEVIAARRALIEARAQTLQSRLARLAAQAELARLAGRAPFGDQ